MLTRQSLTVLTLAALLLSLSPSAAGAQPPSTYAAITVTGVTSGTPAIGSQFTTDMQLSVNTTGPGLVGMEVYIFFNGTPAALNIVNPVDTDSSTPGVQPAILRTEFFGSTPIPAANEVIIAADTIAPGITVPGRTCPGGSYPCIHLAMAGPAQINRTGIVARLNWTGVAAGPTGFAILNPLVAPPPPLPIAPFTALSDADGYFIPINSATATNFSILNAGSIGGIVLRQGVPPGVGPGTHGCTQVDATNGAVVAVPGFTLVAPPPILPAQVNTAGGFLLNLPSGGTYTVRASYPGYLQAQKSNVFVSGGQVLIGTTKLYGGDVNGDNNINILDVVGIIGNLGAAVPVGSVVGCPTDNAFDINDSGTVDIGDLSIATGNFSRTGPTSWAP